MQATTDLIIALYNDSKHRNTVDPLLLISDGPKGASGHLFLDDCYSPLPFQRGMAMQHAIHKLQVHHRIRDYEVNPEGSNDQFIISTTDLYTLETL